MPKKNFVPQKEQVWIDARKKYPLIMEIHGGPHGMYNVAFSPMYQSFAANGFIVLFSNPRGSTGYGSTFGNAIEKNYPGPNYDALMAALDAVVAKGYVDTQRMYVGGCSGGGVLSSYVISQTDRFAAAAVRCPVTNWISMAGTTDIPLFTFQFFEKPYWEDPRSWLEHSTLMHVGNAHPGPEWCPDGLAGNDRLGPSDLRLGNVPLRQGLIYFLLRHSAVLP